MTPDSQTYSASSKRETAKQLRIDSIDFLRGLVMVLMALDHVRDYFTVERIDPTDLDASTVALFFTRWLTHFCAPVFVLLAGVSVGLMAKKRTTKELSLFLLTRGLWLVFAELTFIGFGWQFTLGDSFSIGLQVIWAIGISMIVMSALVWLPFWGIVGFGSVVVLGHNVLDYGLFPEAVWSRPSPFWYFLHEQGFAYLGDIRITVAYPLLPWIGLMPLGYWLASLYTRHQAVRRQHLLTIGYCCVIAFFLVRLFNEYGNARPWQSQDSFATTILSLLNTEKYPPSLAFLLMTLGPGLLILGYSETWRGRLKDWIVTFGRVPFFYYVAHIYLVHLLALIAAEWQGFGWQALAGPFWRLPSGYGFSLPVVWIVWALVIIALYPACRWFASLKARRKDWWLSYL